MERLIVKKILITRANQQLLFQVRLPRDSKRIIGVCLTMSTTKAFKSPEIGSLWLSIPSMGETFHCESLKVNQSPYGVSIMPSINPPGYNSGALWVSGSKIEFSTLNRPVTETIVEGFYSDQRTVDGDYTLTIYLKIEL